MYTGREKEKAQELLRLDADKFNAFVALTDRCFWQMILDINPHVTDTHAVTRGHSPNTGFMITGRTPASTRWF